MTSQATRIDDETGVRDVAEFFGSHELKLFGLRHVPSIMPIGGVVICSPLQAEFVRNYRREVALGKALASMGVAVQRFHYRGFGNSDGEPKDATFETMWRDAVAAAERLVETTDVTRLTFLGTRWGALVAAAASRRFGDRPLALWEPAVDSSRYFQEVLRWRLMHDLREGNTTGQSREGLIAELRERGSVDILGYSIDRPLYESGMGHSLVVEVGPKPRPILLVQFGRPQSLRREYATTVEGWQERGFPAQTRIIAGEEPWWFGGRADDVQESRTRIEALCKATAEWVFDQLSPARAS